MADVSHELGSLRMIVDSPLSSKVAMFNNQAQQHKQAQLLNPFSGPDGRVSPKPQFSKDQYGKPLAGSLTEMRGQKANIHVMREMLELCQIIDSEGYSVKDEPEMRVIPFGELFNIYNYISDKCVGICLRARKHKIVDFEGEMLFQRRDDNVPVFLLKPIKEIRAMLNEKMEEMKRGCSPAPQATSVLLDQSAHQQKLKDQQGLGLPKRGCSKSRSQSPAPPKSTASTAPATPTTKVAPLPTAEILQKVVEEQQKLLQKQQENAEKPPKHTAVAEKQQKPVAAEQLPLTEEQKPLVEEQKTLEVETQKPLEVEAQKPLEVEAQKPLAEQQTTPEITVDAPTTTVAQNAAAAAAEVVVTPAVPIEPSVVQSIDATAAADNKTDINNNDDALPTVCIEATAEYVRRVSDETETVVSHPEADAAANVV